MKIIDKSRNIIFPTYIYQFDIVDCNNVLTHIHKIKKPIKELIRVSKKYVDLKKWRLKKITYRLYAMPYAILQNLQNNYLRQFIN